MAVIARDLSDVCGLPVYADRIWVGGGCLGLGMVFMRNSMGATVRTPEDDRKLKNLEQRLAELNLVLSTPELEILCSSTYRPHLEEPFRMTILDPPESFGGKEILDLVRRLRQVQRQVQRGEGEDANGVRRNLLTCLDWHVP